MSTFEHRDITVFWEEETQWIPWSTWLSHTMLLYQWRMDGYMVEQCKSISHYHHCSRKPHPEYEPHIAVTQRRIGEPVKYLEHWYGKGEPNA